MLALQLSGHASMQAATQDCPERLSPTSFCRLRYSANPVPTYTAAEVPFPRSRLRAATQPLRRSSCLPCSLTEVLDPSPRRRANAGVSGEQMLDVTGSEDDSGTRGGGYATVARLHTASCGDLAYDFVHATYVLCRVT